jgi:hypothetical protein
VLKEVTKQQSSFSVYPNPAINEINFLIANQFHKTINCVITDMLGKVVLENSFIINDDFYKTTININSLKNGCYFVTLKGTNSNETKKIIIQH